MKNEIKLKIPIEKYVKIAEALRDALTTFIEEVKEIEANSCQDCGGDLTEIKDRQTGEVKTLICNGCGQAYMPRPQERGAGIGENTGEGF